MLNLLEDFVVFRLRMGESFERQSVAAGKAVELMVACRFFQGWDL
jgi:hypothetical protein